MVEKIDEESVADIVNKAKKTLWHQIGNVYFPAKPTTPSIPAGFFEVMNTYDGIRYVKKDFSIEGIFPTASPNATEIINDFHKFWQTEKLFNKYEIPYQRGIMLSGVPGSGKTCIIKILADVLINKYKGLALNIKDVSIIKVALEEIRSIQPDILIMVILEDIDGYYNGDLLEVMDGMMRQDKVVFIATTNHPETIGDAILNRPGRFDLHYKISTASEKIREDFIKSLIHEDDIEKVNISRWAKDTAKLPFGHIKELITSVLVLGKNYEETLKRLRTMRDGLIEDDDENEDYYEMPGRRIEVEHDVGPEPEENYFGGQSYTF